jgi:uncharacterized protein (TIGR02271 family)
MSDETIVAVFENSRHADQAVRALESAGVPSSAIERHSKEGQPRNRTDSSSERSAPQSTGFFFWDMMFAGQTPHEDRTNYEQSVERGEVIVAVTVSEQDAEAVMSVLQDHSPLDVDEQTIQDDSTESAPTEQARAPAGRSETARESRDSERTEEGAAAEEAAPARPRRAAAEENEEEGEEVIPLAEEELQVGKRTVNRGTTRIRRYVVENPVEQSVSLRDERVILEKRRPVRDDATGDTFTEKTIEVTETSEVPVTEKVARLKEEVVVRREAAERKETVRDTVRSDQIAVEDASEEAPARRKSNR